VIRGARAQDEHGAGVAPNGLHGLGGDVAEVLIVNKYAL
jgi:hypothetical protein